MLDWFNMLLLGTIIAVIGFIIFSVRKTMGTLSKKGLSDDDMRELAARIRNRDMRCPRCGRQSSAMIGTKVKYKCDSCNYEFEGPKHDFES